MSKHIVLGVTGSIAAHRAADLASLLVKAGHEVRVVLTRDAQRFITPLPFKTLSRNPVITDLYEEEEGWKPAHIRLADEAQLLLIAPATANTLAKLALAGLERARKNPRGARHERSHVAASCHAEPRRHVEGTRGGVHWPGSGIAGLRL